MKRDWTPEPWVDEEGYISAQVPGGRPNGEVIATVHQYVQKSGARDKANSARIVACVNALADVAHPEKLGELLEACIEPREAMVLDGYEHRDVRYCRICQTLISAPIERDGQIVSAGVYHRPDCAFAAIGYEPPDKEG